MYDGRKVWGQNSQDFQQKDPYRMHLHNSSSIKPSDGSAKLILVETNLSFEGPRIMFKDIRMQNNGEVCEVVVISSHVPVKQENVHDFCCHFINNSFVRLENLWKSQDFRILWAECMNLQDLPYNYSNDMFLKLDMSLRAAHDIYVAKSSYFTHLKKTRSLSDKRCLLTSILLSI